jgi:hypothetical protein
MINKSISFNLNLNEESFCESFYGTGEGFNNNNDKLKSN